MADFSDIRAGIEQSARALGINPVDLATAISYETAGTFDPTKAGPTTQWGQHRGLIQFGEPQAQKYGVDWSDPVGSQLGSDGAVVGYLRDAGVRPGMGLLDVYSAINSGSVGRYGASDANNGGAPGTVRDKVANQMAGHRQKADALMGGGGTDTLVGGAGDDRLSTRGGYTMQDEPEKKTLGMSPEFWTALAGGLYNLDRPGSGNDMLQSAHRQQFLKGNDAKDRKSRNRTIEWLNQNGMGQFAPLIESGAVSARDVISLATQQPKDDRTALRRNVEWLLTQNPGMTMEEAIAAAKGGVNVNVGGGPQVGTIPQGYELVQDPETGAYQMRAIPGGPADTSANDAVAQESKARSGGVVTQDIDRALEIIKGAPGWTTGLGAVLSSVPGTQAKSLSGLLQTIKANVGFDRLQQMRDASPTGGALGAINKTEMDLLQAVLGNLEQSLSAEDLTRNLQRVNKIYMDIIHGPGNWVPSEPATVSDDDLLKKYGG